MGWHEKELQIQLSLPVPDFRKYEFVRCQRSQSQLTYIKGGSVVSITFPMQDAGKFFCKLELHTTLCGLHSRIQKYVVNVRYFLVYTMWIVRKPFRQIECFITH